MSTRSVRAYDFAAHRVGELAYFARADDPQPSPLLSRPSRPRGQVHAARRLGWHVRRRGRCFEGRVRRGKKRKKRSKTALMQGESSAKMEIEGGTSRLDLLRRARRRRRWFWRAREQTGRWLETHRWHAKRFKMELHKFDVWTARSCVDRGVRSAVKAVEKGVTLIDLSWWRAWEVMDPAGHTSIWDELTEKLDRFGWEVVAGRWLWSHPSLDASLATLCERQKLRSVALLRFRLTGSRWNGTVEAALGIKLNPTDMSVCIGTVRSTEESVIVAGDWVSTGNAAKPLNHSETDWTPGGEGGNQVLLVPRVGMLCGGFGSGVDVIVDAGTGMRMWTKLIYAGARAIGSDEYRQICLEGGSTRFPADHPPETVSREKRACGGHRNETKRRRTRTKTRVLVEDPDEVLSILHLPPRRRRIGTNRAKWRPRRSLDMIPAEAVIRVQVHVRGRGCPRDGAVLMRPTENDLAFLSKHGHEFPTHERELIGMVTTGGYSFLRGHGFASGAWILARDAEVIFTGTGARRRRNSTSACILFRNPTSRHLRVGFVTPMLHPPNTALI